MAACAPESNPTLATTNVEPTTEIPTFDGNLAYQHLLAQTNFGPRPPGSEAGWQTGNYIIGELKAAGWHVETQTFIFKGTPIRNIIGKTGAGPVIILGAHYDTRLTADADPDPVARQQSVTGANDGASGVAVLLELARILNADITSHQIWLVFFDAEDQGRIDGWPFSVGSREMAAQMTIKPEAVIIVDMVGDTAQTFYYDHLSDLHLSQEIWGVAAELEYGDHFIPQPKYAIMDDHTPFVEQGVTAVDIIDFDYPYWHTNADTVDKVSPESLERVGRTLTTWLAQRP